MEKIKLKVIKDSNGGFVLFREGFPRDFHTHLANKNGCDLVQMYIHKNKLPNSRWLRMSCQRLLTEEEYSNLREGKCTYHNVGGGKALKYRK